MVKPLAFKGDKKSRKRKAPDADAILPRDSESKFLTVSKGNADAEDDDSWVTAEAATDIVGPVLLVLPSDPATCLACDANGKVYADELVNIVEGDPATSEPHDVRHCFIASRVAGTEEISFKGHHGRYDGIRGPGLLHEIADYDKAI